MLGRGEERPFLDLIRRQLVGVLATGLLALFANLLDQDRHPDAREGRPTRIAPFGSSLVVFR